MVTDRTKWLRQSLEEAKEVSSPTHWPVSRGWTPVGRKVLILNGHVSVCIYKSAQWFLFRETELELQPLLLEAGHFWDFWWPGTALTEQGRVMKCGRQKSLRIKEGWSSRACTECYCGKGPLGDCLHPAILKQACVYGGSLGRKGGHVSEITLRHRAGLQHALNFVVMCPSSVNLNSFKCRARACLFKLETCVLQFWEMFLYRSLVKMFPWDFLGTMFLDHFC